MQVMQLPAGFLFGAVIAIAAWRAGALSKSGAIAAALSGGLIYGLGGVRWAALLLAFFVSSSLLSKSFRQRKAEVSEKFSKGSRRDWGQVLANGGLGAMLAVAAALWPDAGWPWVAFIGAMAAVNADTWATELGVLNPTPPRLITSGAIVERGSSGGVSILGSISAMAGAAFIGVGAAAFSLNQAGANPAGLFFAALIGGSAGSFFDSLLGATIQAIYYCPKCMKETERSPIHSCGTPTSPIRGFGWLTNDGVNFAASVVGALLALGSWLVFLQ